MLFYYIENLTIIDIEEVGEEVVYTFATNEEIVKQIEKVLTRYYKKLRTPEEIAVAENKLKQAIADYEERRSNG